MYKATLSFTTKNYDVRKNQILADNFTTQDEIDEFLRIGYIVVYEDTLEITQNGLYDVDDYIQANVDVSSTPIKPILPNGIKFGSSPSTSNNFDWLAEVDTTNITSCASMFTKCTGFTSVPLFNTSNATHMGQMFNGCTNLETIPLFDTGNVTNMNGMFSSCSHLLSVPLFNTISVTDMNNMFNGCRALTEVPVFNTGSVTSMSGMFRACIALTTVPVLNTASVTNMNLMFRDSSNLSSESLNNILAMCINATSYTGTKTLAEIGISSTQATTCQSLSNWNNFISAGWSSGY